ncbi:DUF502 domain-containing protein [Exilibacterium tricleocarpae]|uniref:DUF502 domain-containing protein n=1 Tax=Exilibacterium tricleocarpae TaxID=2591008 RepID=A0A545SYZ7_9GAMM|nr:DUF502 domain-containing protein [Exilibacterium tricleocarpae]TQV70193.1 DUF502 domain-containing protein [Exilibacterium tricleocarpae]
MVRFISKHILTGLVTILPVVLTLYLLYWLAISVESALGGVIRWVIPESFYWPGMGLVAGLGVIFMVGLLMHAYVVQRLFAMGEQLLYHVPIIKTVYGGIREFFDYFSPNRKRDFQQVVSVTFGDTGMRAIGFVTQAMPEHLPGDFGTDGDDSVLVYLPMSYMIGGYAVLVPRNAVRPLNISMEEAMRFILSAGIAGTNGTSARRN